MRRGRNRVSSAPMSVWPSAPLSRTTFSSRCPSSWIASIIQAGGCLLRPDPHSPEPTGVAPSAAPAISVRVALFEAAHVIMTRVAAWSKLKAWAMNVVKRRALPSGPRSPSPASSLSSCTGCGATGRRSASVGSPRPWPSWRSLDCGGRLYRGEATHTNLPERANRIVPVGTIVETSSLAGLNLQV